MVVSKPRSLAVPDATLQSQAPHASLPLTHPRFLPSIVLTLSLVAGLQLGEAREEPLRRAPGEIVLRGDPDGVGDYRLVQAFPNLRFRRPLWIGSPPDGTNRLFVMEQDGRIQWFENRPDVRKAELALDITDRVYRKHNEEGLLGLAFHPGFARNRTLFLHYSANDPRRGVVSRFRTDSKRSRIDRRSERVVLEQPQPWGNHNGGDLQFGPDGLLYITFGDGGAGGDPLGSGQDLGTWLGSMLRIDVDGGQPYRVPADNPFLDVPGARPEIWACGLRNVWRFSFDPLTGDLWAGDVGQNAWEEIDLLVKGGNYGWNAREGKHAFRGRRRSRSQTQPVPARGPLLDPVVDFDTSQARSITGGVVYRGQRHSGLRGTYLFADYATGYVWGLRHDGTRMTGLRVLARLQGISSFGTDQDGEVYATAFDGRIYTFAAGKPDGARDEFPRTLSATGLFPDMARLTPAASLLPYDVNTPLWSDGAAKQRYVMLPGLSKIRVDGMRPWQYPVGTIFVKTFFAGVNVQAKRLETRLLVLRESGWAGYTYVWNDAQTDADLIDGRVTRELDPGARRAGLAATWTFPSRADCMACHTRAAGYVLGFRAEQLDGGDAPDSSLARLERLQCFEGAVPGAAVLPRFPRWDASGADPGQQVRAYLDANCAMCHQPEGPGNAQIDLRYATPLAAMGLVDRDPGEGDLGIRGAKLLVPGQPARSILLERMRRTDAKGMPNLSHARVDEMAVARVRAWIRRLGK
jgi:uncharacterized repeat protein (TIGR03806 family)